MDRQNNPNHVTRCANRQAVMMLLARHGGMIRSELCEATGLTGAGISRITRELIDAGLVREAISTTRNGGVGRKSNCLTIRPDGAFVLGVTLTANRISVGLFDAARSVIGLCELDDPCLSRPKTVIRQLVNRAHRLLHDHDIARERLAGTGVAVGLLLDAVDGCVSSRALGWHKVSVAQPFEEAFGCRVRIEARAAAILRAELGGGCVASDRRILLINCGAGIGSAAYFDDRLIWQDGGGLGNLAHVRVPSSKVPCRCGRRGCLEQLSGGIGVVRAYDEQLVGRVGEPASVAGLLRELVQRAADGEQRARNAFAKAGRHLAHGVDVSVALLAPDEIILAGEIGRQPDFVAGVRDGLRRLAVPFQAEQLRISEATSAEAAASIAVSAFVLSSDLDIERLKAA